MLETARFLDMPASTVWGVATFYNQFRFTPPGKRPVKVCMGTACHLAGGQLVLEATARELDIEIGGITPDREFSLERVACIGCCALAPVVTISEQAYPRMTPTRIEEVLVTIKPAASKQEAGTKPAMTFDEIYSRARANWEPLYDSQTIHILIGTATCGRAAGSMAVLEAFRQGMEGLTIPVRISEVGCMGMCSYEPLVIILKPGDFAVCYHHVTPQIGAATDRRLYQGRRPLP